MFKITILLVLLFSMKCQGQSNLTLTAFHVYPLPTPLDGAAPYYDGSSDSIYLFGGTDSGTARNHIQIFDIVTARVTTVAHLPGAFRRAPVEADSSGNLLCLGGGSTLKEIFKFNLTTAESIWAGQLPYGSYGSTSVKRWQNEILIFGGQGNGRGFLSVNLSSLESTQLDDLPKSLPYTTSQRVGEKALLFEVNSNGYMSIDLQTLEREVFPSNLPSMLSQPSSIYDGEHIYLIGGRRGKEIQQFNPITEKVEAILVDGFPLESPYYFTIPPTTVYVQKLNRIYFFGGTAIDYTNTRQSDLVHLRSVWYVDLKDLGATPSTTEPSTVATPTTTPTTTEGTTTTLNPIHFSCDNRTNGNYPHPTDCSMFISCYDDEMSVHTCPPPLLFDPLLHTCNLPQLVECELSCTSRPDGIYPHPHDCALFVICNEGLTHVYKCPDDMLFDPVGHQCTPPQFYDCPLWPIWI